VIRIIIIAVSIVFIAAALTLLNAFIVDTKPAVLWELWDPFPGYQMKGEYRIYGVTYLNLVAKGIKNIMPWVFSGLLLAFIKKHHKHPFINMAVVIWSIWATFEVFIFVEFLYNYNMVPWGWRLILLLISIISIIGYNMVRHENKN